MLAKPPIAAATPDVLDEAFGGMTDGFCIIQMAFDGERAIDYGFVAINHTFAAHTGLPDAKGRWARDMLPEHEQYWFDLYGKVAKTGTAVHYENRADALGRWFEVHAYRVGDPARHLVAVRFKDITPVKQAYDALRESEDRFSNLADTLPTAVWQIDADGRLHFINEAFRELFGVGDIALDHLDWPTLIHPDERAAFTADILAAARTQSPLQRELRARAPGGQWRWVEFIGAPRHSPLGQYMGLAGSTTDITTRRDVETRREQLLTAERAARTAAERASAVKDEFLGTLSHELRTPLSVVLGWGRLLQKNAAAGDEQLNRGLSAIVRSAETQTALVSDMLDLSGILLGKTVLSTQAINGFESVADYAGHHLPAAHARDIGLHIHKPDGHCWIHADPARLQQIIDNLLSNALKFSQSGGTVTVMLERRDGHCVIEVRDTGAGIPTEFLPHLFDRFRQADASQTRKVGGLGLGLALVKHLVQMHGGRIDAHSDGPSLGAKFVVHLPCMDDVPSDAGMVHERAHRSDASGSESAVADDQALAHRRILLVDDQPDLLEHTRRVLEGLGARVVAVPSAQAALGALRDPRDGMFDAIVSDIGMPDMDGYQLIRKVREDLGLSGAALHAVAVTALARDRDRNDALAAGYQCHIAKPVSVSQLVAALRQ